MTENRSDARPKAELVFGKLQAPPSARDPAFKEIRCSGGGGGKGPKASGSAAGQGIAGQDRAERSIRTWIARNILSTAAAQATLCNCPLQMEDCCRQCWQAGGGMPPSRSAKLNLS